MAPRLRQRHRELTASSSSFLHHHHHRRRRWGTHLPIHRLVRLCPRLFLFPLPAEFRLEHCSLGQDCRWRHCSSGFRLPRPPRLACLGRSVSDPHRIARVSAHPAASPIFSAPLACLSLLPSLKLGRALSDWHPRRFCHTDRALFSFLLASFLSSSPTQAVPSAALPFVIAAVVVAAAGSSRSSPPTVIAQWRSVRG